MAIIARAAEMFPPTPTEIIGQFVSDLFLPTNQPTVKQRIFLWFTIGRMAPSYSPTPPGGGGGVWEPESLPLCNSIPISTNPIAISFLQLGPNSAIPIPNWNPYRNCKSKSGPAPQYWSLDWGGSFY